MNQRIKALTYEQLQQRYNDGLARVEELVTERVRGNKYDYLLLEVMDELTEYKRELMERDELELLADMTEALL